MILFLIIVGGILYNLLKDIKRLIRLAIVCFILMFVFIVVKMKDTYDGVVEKIRTEQVVSDTIPVDTMK